MGNAGRRQELAISVGSRDTTFATVLNDRIPVGEHQSLLSRDLEHREPLQAGVLGRDRRRPPDRAEVDRVLKGSHQVDRPEYLLSPARRQRQLQTLSGVRSPYLILKYMH